MAALMSDKLAVYGQWTYRCAWALEIVAAIIGLATGLALGYQAFAASKSVTAMQLTLASAPFFMIAIAELTKIPIATLLFSASWLWKPIVLAFLVALAGITFATVFTGLEGAATLRQLQYEDLTKQIGTLQFESAQLNALERQAKETDQVSKAQAEVEVTNANAEREGQAIQGQIKDIDREIDGLPALSLEATRASDRVKESEEAKEKLLGERRRQLDDEVRQFERQRESFDRRITDAVARGDLALAATLEAQRLKLQNPRPRIMAEFEPRLRDLDTGIPILRAEFDRLRLLGNPESIARRQNLQGRRNELVRRLDATNETWSQRSDAARKRLADAQVAESNKAQTIAGYGIRQDEISKELSRLEAERIPMARTDQIRSIAARIYGTKPEDVTVDRAQLVSVGWFGSLALLAALAGPLTAIVALALQRIAAQADRPSPSKLSRLLRRILLSWRWRRVRTVAVPVEVIVERPVEKRIEVAVEVEKVIKEILYIPVLTDDPDALRRALGTILPEEVADLVKISARGGQRAGTP